MKIQGVAFILNQSASFTRDPVSYSKNIAAVIKFLIFFNYNAANASLHRRCKTYL